MMWRSCVFMCGYIVLLNCATLATAESLDRFLKTVDAVGKVAGSIAADSKPPNARQSPPRPIPADEEAVTPDPAPSDDTAVEADAQESEQPVSSVEDATALREKADGGDVEAQVKLGRSYWLGTLATPVNYKLAAKYLVPAANKKDGAALYILGRMYDNGNAYPKDPVKARQFYASAYPKLQPAADKGDLLAMWALGAALLNGRGVQTNQTGGVEWFRKAAEAGDAAAMNNLGWCYENGVGSEKDLLKAVEWYSKAADAGIADAMHALGWLYGNGVGVDKDPVKSFEWERKAADAGSSDGMYSLGWHYGNGSGVQKDPVKAVEWYRKALEAGNAAAMLMLGLAYADGAGVEKDPAKAVEWYRKATAAGDEAAMGMLGLAYAEGAGVEKDPTKAVEWYHKAAAAGNPVAMSTLAECYENGTGVEKDVAKAVRWYRKAADAGVTEAAAAVARLERKNATVAARKEKASSGPSRDPAVKVKGLYIGMPIDDVPSILKEKLPDNYSVSSVTTLAECPDLSTRRLEPYPPDSLCVVAGVPWGTGDDRRMDSLQPFSKCLVLAEPGGEVYLVKFSPECVNTVFKAQGMETSAFVQAFADGYRIPQFSPSDDLQKWVYASPDGTKVTILENKTVCLSKVASVEETRKAFD